MEFILIWVLIGLLGQFLLCDHDNISFFKVKVNDIVLAMIGGPITFIVWFIIKIGEMVVL